MTELHDAYPVYRWFPDVLMNATHSAEDLAYQLQHHLKTHVAAAAKDPIAAFVRHILLENGLGVYDASDEEMNSILDNMDPWPASYKFADIISRRSQVGWSTHGHSAVDVNIYASNPKHARKLIGNHENTEIGEFIREYLDVDLDSITKELQEEGAKVRDWMGKPLEVTDSTADQDHYQGDFKRSLDCDCGVVH